MTLFKHTFKTARPILWKIEKHYKLNLLNMADYEMAMRIYDCFQVISHQYYMRHGHYLNHDDRIDWALFLAEINLQKRYN